MQTRSNAELAHNLFVACFSKAISAGQTQPFSMPGLVPADEVLSFRKKKVPKESAFPFVLFFGNSGSLFACYRVRQTRLRSDSTARCNVRVLSYVHLANSYSQSLFYFAPVCLSDSELRAQAFFGYFLLRRKVPRLPGRDPANAKLSYWVGWFRTCSFYC